MTMRRAEEKRHRPRYTKSNIVSILDSIATIGVLVMDIKSVDDDISGAVDYVYDFLWSTEGLKLATETYLDQGAVENAIKSVVYRVIKYEEYGDIRAIDF